MKSLKFGGFLVLLILVVVKKSEGSISCSDVSRDLVPCLSYLVSGSGMPPSDCCDGVKALSSAAVSSEDKKVACQCIKSAAGNVNYNPELARDLPTNCGITLPFPVSADIDCSSIS